VLTVNVNNSPTAPNAAEPPVFAELSGLRLARKHRMGQPREGLCWYVISHSSGCCYYRKRFPLHQEWRLRRGLSGLTIFLLLADLRSGLGDAAFYEISLNLELLLRA
jgi:hypothetical protein